MGALTLLSNLFGALKEFFGFQSKKLDLNNTKEMQVAAEKVNKQAEIDKINKAIAEKDVDEIRKNLS